jgi:hypothetical protein
MSQSRSTRAWGRWNAGEGPLLIGVGKFTHTTE